MPELPDDLKPTPEDLARELADDLALCLAARPQEEWAAGRGQLHANRSRALDPGGSVIVLYDDDDWCAQVFDHMSFGCDARAYAELFAAAPAAWPAAIRRALAAEAELAAIRRQLEQLPDVCPDLPREPEDESV